MNLWVICAIIFGITTCVVVVGLTAIFSHSIKYAAYVNDIIMGVSVAIARAINNGEPTLYEYCLVVNEKDIRYLKLSGYLMEGEERLEHVMYFVIPNTDLCIRILIDMSGEIHRFGYRIVSDHNFYYHMYYFGTIAGT